MSCQFSNRLTLALLLTASSGFAQTAAGSQWKTPRTPDGHPDLQGTWSNVFATPLERPKNLGEKAFYTEEEAAAFETAAAARPDSGGDAVADPAVWWEKRVKSVSTRRTSLVFDPPDGRIPALTPGAQKRMADARAESRKHPADGPEDRSLQERCILSTVGGPVPMLPGPYNNNYQIVQTRDYLIIVLEMIHDVRVIPISHGKPELKTGVRQWLGESHGRWEGDTFVVDTGNFTDRVPFHGSDGNLHLIEKFTRTAPDVLLYQFTIDDPTAFTAPWSAEIPFTTSDGAMYEFGCHEGNAALANMLITARKAEQAEKTSHH